jgi:hypothetical protein
MNVLLLHVLLIAATAQAQPPDTTIGPAPRFIFGSSARFTFSATPAAGATFECSLDTAPFVACPPDGRFTNVPAGSHVLQVRAKNADGVVDPTPAWWEWISEVPGVDLLTAYAVVGNSDTGRYPAGWTGAVEMSVTDNVQAVVEGSGDYVDLGSGGAIDRVTRYWLLSGVRVVGRSPHANLFGQALAGIIRAPDQTTGHNWSNHPAFEIGGGFELNFNSSVAVRFGAGFRFIHRETDTPVEWQFTNGVVWRFNRRD